MTTVPPIYELLPLTDISTGDAGIGRSKGANSPTGLLGPMRWRFELPARDLAHLPCGGGVE
jgi:hypothetical protein